MNTNIRLTIEEYTNEGYEYLYDEQPSEMEALEKYLQQQKYFAREIYRRTDYQPFMNCKKGDILNSNRVSSWSLSYDIPNSQYEGIDSIMFILHSQNVNGLDISNISPYGEEKEILLTPCKLMVVDRDGDEVIVKCI
jgi:hypothetical protein